jgi:hypothetical protein
LRTLWDERFPAKKDGGNEAAEAEEMRQKLAFRRQYRYADSWDLEAELKVWIEESQRALAEKRRAIDGVPGGTNGFGTGHVHVGDEAFRTSVEESKRVYAAGAPARHFRTCTCPLCYIR